MLDIQIGIVGVGGAGSNCVTRVYKEGIRSAKTIAINTDKAHLIKLTQAHEKILLGKGLGAGGNVSYAKAMAEKHLKEISKALEGLGLVFITAGMGGGTGTGVAPIVAKLAKEQGAITVAMVGYPFKLERARLKIAHQGIMELLDVADTVVVLDNNKLLEYAPNLPIDDAFKLADEIVGRAVRGISDAIMFPSLMNIDFADLRTIMGKGGLSVIAVGEGHGPTKVEDAVNTAIKHPLLEVDIEGAKGAIIHLEGSPELTLGDAVKAGNLISKAFVEDAEVKLGARLTPGLEDTLYLTLVATGVTSPNFAGGTGGKKEDDLEGLDITSDSIDIELI